MVFHVFALFEHLNLRNQKNIFLGTNFSPNLGIEWRWPSVSLHGGLEGLHEWEKNLIDQLKGESKKCVVFIDYRNVILWLSNTHHCRSFHEYPCPCIKGTLPLKIRYVFSLFQSWFEMAWGGFSRFGGSTCDQISIFGVKCLTDPTTKGTSPPGV